MNRYESHITLLKPDSTEKAKKLLDLAAKHKMKCSWITGDPVLGVGKWFYISGYDTDFTVLKDKVMSMSMYLKAAGFEVVREKIEQIMWDTKTGYFQCGVDCFACLDT